MATIQDRQESQYNRMAFYGRQHHKKLLEYKERIEALEDLIFQRLRLDNDDRKSDLNRLLSQAATERFVVHGHATH